MSDTRLFYAETASRRWGRRRQNRCPGTVKTMRLCIAQDEQEWETALERLIEVVESFG